MIQDGNACYGAAHILATWYAPWLSKFREER
jgi:hypothetical protein